MYFSKNRGDHKICDLVKPARCPRPKALVCSLDCPACPQVRMNSRGCPLKTSSHVSVVITIDHDSQTNRLGPCHVSRPTSRQPDQHLGVSRPTSRQPDQHDGCLAANTMTNRPTRECLTAKNHDRLTNTLGVSWPTPRRTDQHAGCLTVNATIG